MAAVLKTQKLTTRPKAVTVLLLMGFAASVFLRVAVGWPDVSHSAVAGLLFAICLTLLTLAAGSKAMVNRKTIAIGFAGGVFLCLPSLIIGLLSPASRTPEGNYLVWGIIVSTVAIAEEAFLRGALYDVLSKTCSQTAVIAITAIAFALLHIPLYGWSSVPLNLAAGLFLGALRQTSGSFIAPGISHAMADLVGWWLR